MAELEAKQLENLRGAVCFENAEMTQARSFYSKGALDAYREVLELEPERTDDDTD